MNQPLRLGIAGLGTVGAGVVKIIQSKSELLRMRTGRDIEIVAVSARSAGKDRGVDLSAYRWHDDPVSLAQSDDIDVFVELVGGDEGPAKDATEAALKSGKDVVTANKAMLAHHGQALAELAEGNDLTIRYEAAVAGGIPIIKSLTEGLAGNKIKRVMGVMNGTCNYILTRMQSAGLSYDEVFAEADALGYLEADPNLDVGGIDAGHKLAILSAIAYGVQVDFDAVKLEGIGQISIDDINHAADMGYRIKLLGVSQMTENGLEQRMTPCLVPETSPLGQLEGGTNMVVVEGDEVGSDSSCAVQVPAKAPPPARSCRMCWTWPVAFVFQPLVNLQKRLELRHQRNAIHLPPTICVWNFWIAQDRLPQLPRHWDNAKCQSTACANTITKVTTHLS
jgi:homoserine dehydrogenase